MKTSCVIFAALVIAPLVTAQTKAKADPREKLDTAIPEAIRLLEAKEYETFLEKFVPPDLFKKITKETTLKEFATRFGKDKAADLLRVLKSIKDQKPTLDSKGTKATFKLKNEDKKGKDSISFVKVGKFWYIQN